MFHMRNLIETLALLISFFFSYHKYNEEISVHFSVIDNCSEYIIDRIDKAEKSVEFCSYILTDNKIKEALLKAKKRGIKVRGVVEKKNLNKQVKDLKKEKIVKIRGRKKGIMHHKFIIIDRSILITGSYNLTFSANNMNDENFVTIKDKSIISKYLQEFLRLWN